ncbi:hypothetical protein GST81_13020 (plasmid) [Enterococcus faecium]|uniref:hypothetical protein n=2 Tax=Enterococcus TaxID=1350 RepID=UPI001BAAA7EC|nr:hypothetical protein [Enterococcus faecium]QUR72443.1 hypothetical protein GST81_13020 [Enterococcus faecium]
MVNNDLNDINKRIEKLKIQKNILRANSEQNINRKRRTKRLIEKGALLEKYFEIDYLTVEETEEFLKIFSEYIKANKPKSIKKGKIIFLF